MKYSAVRLMKIENNATKAAHIIPKKEDGVESRELRNGINFLKIVTTGI